jgi:serine/threonine protein kinase/tetratricopeptide (TPR) repeat protein
MPLHPATRLGPYEIVAFIGAGGMGEVYRARDTRLDRDVAVKVLTERLGAERGLLSLFRTEAKAIAALSHPNIVCIYDAELQHSPFFLVTELLEGETIRRGIERSPLVWRRAVEIGAAVADGLGAAHAAGIVHLDLKPENIFVTARHGVKILDFGLARLKRGAEESGSVPASTLSDVHVVMGTVGYMAPEQVRAEPLTAATDMFSLGCVLYEMLSGRRAFQGSTAASTLAAILHEEPRRVTEYVKEVPPELDRWIAHCLAKDPDQRPQSAHDLALTLRDVFGERKPGRRESGANAKVESVAVLPFFTSSTSPDAEYLADGISETLINNLAQLRSLRVVARSTVFRHKGKDVDPIQIGQELGVSAVLSGRIFQRGDILVIAAELVRVADGSQLWGQQYKRQMTDIFSIEDEISTEISGRLRVRFTESEQVRLTRHYTENPEAYQLYLRGRHCWNKRTIGGMQEALRYFQQAIDTDPSYARAYTGLADCMSMLSIYGETDARQGHTRAKAAQEMALQIDPELAEAHASRGFRLLLFDWKFGEAEEALRRALDLNPGYASAHQWLGFTLGLTMRFQEARAAMRVAQELDPFSASINTSAVWPVYWAHLFDEAVEGFRSAAALHPGYWVAHYFLGLSYAQQGEYGRAILALRHAVEIGDSMWRYAGLGFVYGQAGQLEQAREILTKLEQVGHERYVPAIYSAAVHCGLGDTDRTLKHLERAVEERNWEITWLHVNPLWDSMRSDPRLHRLQAQLGLPHIRQRRNENL